MDTFVFLGPSLSRDEAASLIDARFVPPAEAGDVIALMELRPAAIVLIDGCFEQVPAIRHKELLFALSRGVHVFGASSMGALRAAELHPFGVRGIGQVFAWYQAGEIEDDDEVAVCHAQGDEQYRPLSEALVNIRHGLDIARDGGVIAGSTRDALLEAARRVFYAERSWGTVLREGRRLGVEARELGALDVLVRERRPNIKRADAMLALRTVAAELRAGLAPHTPRFELEHTVYFLDALERSRQPRPELAAALREP